MKLVFYINYLNHHQVALTDAFYNELGHDFLCVCTMPTNNSELKGGNDFSSREYCVNATASVDGFNLAMKYAREANVCLFGANSYEFALERAKQNLTGLSFEVGERWLKKGIINVLSPRFLKWLYLYYAYFRKRKFYSLCASAFAAGDMNLVGAYKKKCFKWGYFIETTDLNLYSRFQENFESDGLLRIMWCSRFLSWKHPELCVRLALRLKCAGYQFVINMFGEGEELEAMKRLAKQLDVEDVVNFCGNKPNYEIVSEMRQSDLFIFTSDRNEGWGVVLNEAMSNGVTVVASNEIGSAPYLVEDNVNGCMFKSGDLDSLEQKVIYLIKHPEERSKMAQNAYQTMHSVWSPKNAVKSFLSLITHNMRTSAQSGPCSLA